MFLKAKSIFISSIVITSLLLSGLFLYLFKIENSVKNYDSYKNSLISLLLIEKDFTNFFHKNSKLINFDYIVSKTNEFEEQLSFLEKSDIKKDFGNNFTFLLKDIQIDYLKKSELIEDYKSRHSTRLNSIHYLFDLNSSITKDSNFDKKIKAEVSQVIFLLVQDYVNVNENEKVIKEHVSRLTELSSDKKIDYFVKHTLKVLELKKELAVILKKSNEIDLNASITRTVNSLEISHDKEMFHQLIIALMFFIFSVILIIVMIKLYLNTLKIQNELQAFKYAVQHSDNSVVLTDANKNILYVNEIFESNSGYEKSEVLGNKPKVLQSGLTPQSRYKELDENLSRGEKWEGEFINKRKDGTIFYEKASIVPIFLNGEVINYLAIKLDITKYIRQQQELKESAIVFENTQEGILIIDRSGDIINANKAYETISGYSIKELIGTKPNVLTTNRQDKMFYKKVLSHLNKYGHFKGKVSDIAKDGTLIPTWLNITAVRNKEGKILKYISIHTNLQEIIDTQEKADFLAYHDSLTSLPNRVMLEEHLNHVIDVSKRNNYSISLLFLDLDRFKIINDTLGHNIGDKLLIEVSSRIKSVLRQSDMLARMGGDEFVIVLESAKNKSSAAFVCEKILEIVKQPVKIDNFKLNTSASIGVAMYPDDGKDMQTLIKNADTAMYYAKKQGKDTFEYYDEKLSEDVHDQLVIEQALKQAVEKNELYLNYQPQYDLHSKKTKSFEALVRWDCEKLGFVSPASFIPVAEDTGLIVPIGEFIFKKACEDFMKFKEIDRTLEYIAINISSVQFRSADFLSKVKSIINEVGIKPNQIELELTERYIMDFGEDSIKMLNELKSLGFKMSIDDFGTGYSSMSYLSKLPVETIKIDKAFIDNIPKNNSNLQISKAIIALSKSLGYKTVAEGIEYPEQEDTLADLGCEIGQGYFYSKPLSFEDAKETLAQNM
ncbi:EAL domain-containing protein [Arcobacter sp. YIC-464]|uniref:EAL domain-containing protein n=1 Tax=Arcobacter sp. YIC-464 TaxID=3376631 RepID=UPI003C1776FE